MEKKTIYDSRDVLTYDEYLEYCEDNGIEPKGENSNDFWNWVSETNDMYWDDMIENMKCSRLDTPLMITGTLGLWTGRHDIKPVLIESEDYGKKFSDGTVGYHNPSILKAVLRTVTSSDYLDIDICCKDGYIEVNCHHHDGTNSFAIRKLSKKGIAAVNSAIDRDIDFEPKEYWFKAIKSSEIDF